MQMMLKHNTEQAQHVCAKLGGVLLSTGAAMTCKVLTHKHDVSALLHSCVAVAWFASNSHATDGTRWLATKVNAQESRTERTNEPM
jgi:hypothetical protein